MRTWCEHAVFTGGGVFLDQRGQSQASGGRVRSTANLLSEIHGGGGQFSQPGVAQQRFGDFVEVWSEPHIRPDAGVGACVTIDFMASIASVFADGVVALHELGGGWLWITRAGLEIDDLMVTLQAARFLKPL